MDKTDMQLQIKRTSLVDAVVEQMLMAVAKKQFLVGDRIPSEKILAKKFGVSRTTLREAFKRLENLGIVSIRQGSGTYLLHNDVQAIRITQDIEKQDADLIMNAQRAVTNMFELENYKLSHYIEARTTLETSAFLLATERALPYDLMQIETVLEQQEAIANQADRFPELDYEFHRLLILASHNEFYEQFWNFLVPYFNTQIMRVYTLPGMVDNARSLHNKIYRALVDQDTKGGKALIRDHLGTIPGRMISRAAEELDAEVFERDRAISE